MTKETRELEEKSLHKKTIDEVHSAERYQIESVLGQLVMTHPNNGTELNSIYDNDHFDELRVLFNSDLIEIRRRKTDEYEIREWIPTKRGREYIAKKMARTQEIAEKRRNEVKQEVEELGD